MWKFLPRTLKQILRMQFSSNNATNITTSLFHTVQLGIRAETLLNGHSGHSDDSQCELHWR